MTLQEFSIKQRVPRKRLLLKGRVSWRQGYFDFYEKKRLSSLTDVKFIRDDTLLVAHRAAARLYLVDISQTNHRIISELEIADPGSKRGFLHPDLMTMHRDSIYISSFTDRVAKVRIHGNQLILEEVKSLSADRYHGCYADQETLLLGPIHTDQIPCIDYTSGKTEYLTYNNFGERRIKTLGRHEELYVTGQDIKWHKGETGYSYFSLYERAANALLLLDEASFIHTQTDGHVYVRDKGVHLITLQDGADNCGYIVSFGVENRKLKLIRKTKVADFPHGIDVCGDRVAYTLYSTSSVVLAPLTDFT
ncbi:hypothetical protein [Pseudomaricurvus sp. HS19]|uniref:hypothetical protein n=1 Tax=Pseudomaricurvus sp. HS19 TaxID=2692626 RepID=UPI0013719562|nr:hypothetical protein [Pseudomaricurvus sp. HS19]MYM62833.1 hypothetical protein [Pseudomaricurvus sp. HS19]